MVWWLVAAERVGLANGQPMPQTGRLPRQLRSMAAPAVPTFIFDSSHHLNCHSNFLPKIAPFGRDPDNRGVTTVTWAIGRLQGVAPIENGELK
jgi:hypothetical protein